MKKVRKSKPHSINRILCIDAALRNMGVVEATYSAGRFVVHSAITYSTKPKDKKSPLSAGEHDTYCAKYLSKCISKHILEYKPDLVCTEIGSGAQSSKAASALGAMKGFMGSLMAQHESTIWVIVTPNQAKQIVKKGAKKNLIMAWVGRYHGGDIKWDKVKCRFEHQADAVIIGYAGIKKYFELGVNHES